MEDNYKKEWYDKNKGKVADYNKKYYERKVKRLSGEDNTMVEIKGDDVIIRISREQLKELLMGDVVGKKDAGDRKRKDVSGRKESRVRRRERGNRRESRRGSRKDKSRKDKGGKDKSRTDKSRRGSRKDKGGHKRRHSKK